MTKDEQKEHAKVCEERAAQSNLIAELDGTVNNPGITDSEKVSLIRVKLKAFLYPPKVEEAKGGSLVAEGSRLETHTLD